MKFKTQKRANTAVDFGKGMAAAGGIADLVAINTTDPGMKESAGMAGAALKTGADTLMNSTSDEVIKKARAVDEGEFNGPPAPTTPQPEQETRLYPGRESETALTRNETNPIPDFSDIKTYDTSGTKSEEAEIPGGAVPLNEPAQKTKGFDEGEFNGPLSPPADPKILNRDRNLGPLSQVSSGNRIPSYRKGVNKSNSDMPTKKDNPGRPSTRYPAGSKGHKAQLDAQNKKSKSQLQSEAKSSSAMDTTGKYNKSAHTKNSAALNRTSNAYNNSVKKSYLKEREGTKKMKFKK